MSKMSKTESYKYNSKTGELKPANEYTIWLLKKRKIKELSQKRRHEQKLKDFDDFLIEYHS